MYQDHSITMLLPVRRKDKGWCDSRPGLAAGVLGVPATGITPEPKLCAAALPGLATPKVLAALLL